MFDVTACACCWWCDANQYGCVGVSERACVHEIYEMTLLDVPILKAACTHISHMQTLFIRNCKVKEGQKGKTYKSWVAH